MLTDITPAEVPELIAMLYIILIQVHVLTAIQSSSGVTEPDVEAIIHGLESRRLHARVLGVKNPGSCVLEKPMPH